ncbi:hypothetical protein ACLFKT_11435 [Paraburkholderia sp. BR14261]
MAELDLSGPRPLVLVDGEPLQGVATARVEVNPDNVPVLVLRVIRFEVKGGSLPHGCTLFDRRKGG